MKRVMLAIMSGLLLSCQGQGAVMAQEATAALATGAGSLIHRTRALDTLDRRLAHSVTAERTPTIRPRLAERRPTYLALTEPRGLPSGDQRRPAGGLG